jgi:hypothetical protein
MSIRLGYSTDGKNWTELGQPLDVKSLPPWDRGLRVGLTCGGAPGACAQFQNFEMTVGK